MKSLQTEHQRYSSCELKKKLILALQR